MSLARSSFIVASFTMLSRMFGFIRDVLIANVLGASWMSDAFFVAFKLPNFFRRLFGEGAFNAAFIPLFSSALTKDGKEQSLRFASDVMSVLILVLLALNAVLLLGMPWFLHIFAPGFVEDPQKFTTTTELSRIAFPYIFFISLVALLSGILNSFEKFAAVAFTPVLLNFCLIGALLFFAHAGTTPAHALAWAVALAGFVQLSWLIYQCRKMGILPRLKKPELNSNVKNMLLLMAPAALGAGVAQINLLIDMVLASTMQDAVSYLYYADRLNELPLGVVGVAVGTALLPMLSKQMQAGNLEMARYSMNRAIELSMVVALPAAIALMILPLPLIVLLFEHGAFTRADTIATFPALIAYACGLPAFILIKIFAPGFYANKDTKTPFKIATLCVGINLVFNLILMQFIAHIGLALATSIAGWINASLMGYVLYRRRVFAPDRALILRFIRILICCTLFAVMLLLIVSQFGFFYNASLSIQIGAMTVLIVSAKVFYGGLAYHLHAIDRETVLHLLKRKTVSAE